MLAPPLKGIWGNKFGKATHQCRRNWGGWTNLTSYLSHSYPAFHSEAQGINSTVLDQCVEQVHTWQYKGRSKRIASKIPMIITHQKLGIPRNDQFCLSH